ncbi:NAD(P)H-dependent oxidoreductase [Flavobacterium sp. LM4]|uniref:NAD(P)H-dependent oxidoreductase n=1 Tax=Flavobacterium sp. LM4 TaxID=1938609 RepID=UPI000992F1FA|nr:NAD(P)H-dependent oxidoreductase [Flavobacterium sp. LM4]OOV20457.1 NADPH quinone reductase MdaB [Flavobacterium sp. LM4]
MKKIFIIDGSMPFAHSGGTLNTTIINWDKLFFIPENGFDLRVTYAYDSYEVSKEVENFLWADIIIYHFPIWWMYIPFPLKEYFDRVLTAGHKKLYYSDGRKAGNHEHNYGTGGLLHSRKYMVTTTWNAPETAFSLTDEFFEGRSVDDGVLFPFHKMNAFCGLEPLTSFHFHDVEKNMDSIRLKTLSDEYHQHLIRLFQ